MELLKLYRKKALMPWAIGGICCVGAAIFLMVAAGEEWSTILLIAGLYMIAFFLSTFQVITGLGTRGFRRYAETLTPEGLEELCGRYHSGYRFGQAVLTEDCVIVLTKQVLDVLSYSGIVWIYQVGRISRPFAGAIHTIAIVTDERKTVYVDVVGREIDNVQDFLGKIRRKNPGIITGYSRELVRLFRRDFEQFKERARSQNEAKAQPEVLPLDYRREED